MKIKTLEDIASLPCVMIGDMPQLHKLNENKDLVLLDSTEDLYPFVIKKEWPMEIIESMGVTIIRFTNDEGDTFCITPLNYIGYE
jgi:hypothetical protein